MNQVANRATCSRERQLTFNGLHGATAQKRTLQNAGPISHLSHACYMADPPHPYLFDCTDNYRRISNKIKLIQQSTLMKIDVPFMLLRLLLIQLSLTSPKNMYFHIFYVYKHSGIQKQN
jgi:hypothetical protein